MNNKFEIVINGKNYKVSKSYYDNYISNLGLENKCIYIDYLSKEIDISYTSGRDLEEAKRDSLRYNDNIIIDFIPLGMWQELLLDWVRYGYLDEETHEKYLDCKIDLRDVNTINMEELEEMAYTDAKDALWDYLEIKGEL